MSYVTLPIHTVYWKYPCSYSSPGCDLIRAHIQQGLAWTDRQTNHRCSWAEPGMFSSTNARCCAFLLPWCSGRVRENALLWETFWITRARSDHLLSLQIPWYLLEIQVYIPRPLGDARMLASLATLCRPHADVGEPPPAPALSFLVPWCAVKEASISHLRGGFMLAVDALTAVLIRFTKSFGIKVLSKYKTIKIQLCTENAVSLVFTLLAAKPMTLVKPWTGSQYEDDFAYVS